MPLATRHRAAVALLAFAIAAVAGWFTASSPAEQSAHRITALTTVPAAHAATGAASSPAAKTPAAALAALERTLLAKLDPAYETYSGERLAELCFGDQPGDLPGPNEAFSYANRWAAKDPQGIFEWFLKRGKFTLPASNGNYGFLNIIFHEWAKHDVKAAVVAAWRCGAKQDRATAMANVIETLRKSDPARAAMLARENLGALSEDAATWFDASGADFEDTWAFLRGLPSGKNRTAILARYFDELTRYHARDTERLWREAPEDIRRELAAGGFMAKYIPNDEGTPGKPSDFDGLHDLMRQHAETTGDPAAAQRFMTTGGREWAQRDPAAAVGWALTHLKGEYRVTATAQLFLDAAAHDFDAARHAWEALPEGILKSRAAGNIAAGAPESRGAEVDALLAAMPASDLSVAEEARNTAGNMRRQRAVMENVRKEERHRP